LHFGKTEIFLQRGLDTIFADLPVGQINQPVGQIVGWVEPYAKPIAVVQSMMGIAFAPPIQHAAGLT
jgi:hypothetical protein